MSQPTYPHRCSNVPRWDLEEARSEFVLVFDLVRALKGIKLPTISDAAYCRIEQLALSGAYIHHHVRVDGRSADTAIKVVPINRRTCVRLAQAIHAGPKAYNFPGLSDLGRAIAAVLEQQRLTRPTAEQIAAAVDLDQMFDSSAMDLAVTPSEEESRKILYQWIQNHLVEGVVAPQWLFRAMQSRVKGEIDPSDYYPPFVRQAVKEGRYITIDLTFEDTIQGRVPVIDVGGGRGERYLFSVIGWEWTRAVCYIVRRIVSTGYVPDVILVDGHAAYRAYLVAILRAAVFIDVWVAPFGKLLPAERIHTRRRNHLTIPSLLTHSGLVESLAFYELDYGANIEDLDWRRRTNPESDFLRYWPLRNIPIRNNTFSFFGARYAAPAEFDGLDLLVGYNREKRTIAGLSVEFGVSSDSRPRMEAPVRDVHVLFELPAKRPIPDPWPTGPSPLVRYRREMRVYEEWEMRPRRGPAPTPPGPVGPPVSPPPGPGEPPDPPAPTPPGPLVVGPPPLGPPVTPPPGPGEPPDPPAPTPPGAPIAGPPPTGPQGPAESPPPGPAEPPDPPTPGPKGPTIGEILASETRYEIGRRADWEKVSDLPCSVDEAEERRVYAQNMRLRTVAGRNVALRRVAIALWRAPNFGTRFVVYGNINADPDALVVRGKHVISAPPGRRPLTWGQAKEFFRWIGSAIDRAEEAAPSDLGKAVEILENVRAHLDVLSCEADLRERALAVVSKVVTANKDLLEGRIERALRTLRGTRQYLPRDDE